MKDSKLDVGLVDLVYLAVGLALSAVAWYPVLWLLHQISRLLGQS